MFELSEGGLSENGLDENVIYSIDDFGVPSAIK